MSKQGAQSFFNRVNGDAALLREVKALKGDMTALIRMGAQVGFGFSAEDWTAVMTDLERAHTGELSEQELDKVAGGSSPWESPTAVEKPVLAASWSWGATFCATGEH